MARQDNAAERDGTGPTPSRSADVMEYIADLLLELRALADLAGAERLVASLCAAHDEACAHGRNLRTRIQP